MRIPFNFKNEARGRAQKKGVTWEAMDWQDDTPRKLISEDGYVMVASFPKITDKAGTVS